MLNHLWLNLRRFGLPIVALAGGFSGLIISFLVNGDDQFRYQYLLNQTHVESQERYATLAKQNSIDQQRRMADMLELQLKQISRVAARRGSGRATEVRIAEAAITSRLDKIESDLAAISSRESKIEDSIMNSPEKALSIPLMRKDLDELKAENDTRMDATKHSIDQVYDINKWLLGAMAVAIISLALNNLIRRPEKDRT